MATALSESQLAEQLRTLEGWQVKDGKLHAELEFQDFVQAFAFMTSIALLVEKMDHHPEWFNVYNRVVIDLVTHDAGNAISERDIKLARAINERLERL